MKNIKKLTILLLSLVMAFSCLAVFAFAEENNDEEKIAAIEALVEYYNDEGIYVCDDFDGTSVGKALEMPEDSAGAYEIVDGKTAFVAAMDGSNVMYSSEIAIPEDAESVAMVYSFCLTADGSADKGYLALEFSGSSVSGEAADAQNVLVFDYNVGKAYFASVDAGVVLASQQIDGFVPANGTWYTLSMIYTPKSNAFVGKVSAEGGEEYAFEYALDGMIGLSVLQLRNRNLGNKGVSVAWDCLEIYEGSFIRSNLAGERQKYLDGELLGLMQEYDSASDGVKAAIVKIVDDLFSMGYAPTAGSDAEAYYNQKFSAEMVSYLWDRFVTKVDKFDASLKFDARYALLVDAKAPEADFPAKPAGITEDFYNAYIDSYNKEAAELAIIEEYSLKLKEMVPLLGGASNYAELLDCILDFEAAREFLKREDGSYDDTYFGIPYVIEVYESALDKFASAKISARDYIAAVNAMQNVVSNNFGDMWNAYNVANQIMAQPDFAFINGFYYMSLIFDDAGEFVEYDGRLCEIDSISADGRKATVLIDYLPYTMTLSNHTLILEGNGMRVVFVPADDGDGLEFSGEWKVMQTVEDALALYNERKAHIETGAKACQDLISEINNALLAKGYDVRVAKRDIVIGKYSATRAKYEEGGVYFGYSGVAEALAAFDAFCTQIDVDKVNADAYIAKVQELKAATTYAEIKALIDALTPMYALGNVEGYVNEISSVRDANDIYYTNKNIVEDAEGNALAFIAKVNEVVAVDDLATRLKLLREAQKLVSKLQDGATGVVEAKEIFVAEKASYLADAAKLNESAKEQGEKLVNIALSNVKFVAPQKLVFIIKKVYEL